MDVNTTEKPVDIVKIKMNLEIKSPPVCEKSCSVGTVKTVVYRYCCPCFFVHYITKKFKFINT